MNCLYQTFNNVLRSLSFQDISAVLPQSPGFALVTMTAKDNTTPEVCQLSQNAIQLSGAFVFLLEGRTELSQNYTSVEQGSW